MKSTEIEQFKSILGELKEDLQSLREKAFRLNATIESNYLPPEEVTTQLADALRRYREKADLLERTGANISISIGESIDRLDADIVAAEKEAQLGLERQIILDYFRLTAAAESVRKELEDSKRVLMVKCRLPVSDQSNALEPFKLVVKKVQDNSNDLQDEEFKYLEETIGRPITRALDRRYLVIDQGQDIAAYLDSSCPILMPDGENVLPMLAGQDAGMKSKDKPVSVNDDSTVEEDVGDTEKPLRLWKKFGGYTDETTVSFSDEPAYSLGASKFTSMAKQRPNATLDMFIAGHQKFIEETDHASAEDHYTAPSAEMNSYLINHGYFTDVVIRKGGNSRTFHMLTSKGWACYTKTEVVKFLNNRKMSLVVPAHLRMKNSDITPLNALKLLAIHDYFSARKPQKNYVVVPATAEMPMYANELSNEEKTAFMIVPAVFEAGNETTDLDALGEMIRTLEPESRLHIVVFSRDDILLLNALLALDPVEEEKVRYCLYDQPEILYDGTGTEVVGEMEDKEVEEMTSDGDPERGAPLDDGGILPADDQKNNGGSDVPTENENVCENGADRTAKPESHTKATPPSEKQKTEQPTAGNKNCLENYAEMLKSGKLYCATAYLKTMADSDAQYKELYRQLAYAVNDPLFHCSYSSEKIFEVYYDTLNPAAEHYIIAATLRNYFYDQCSYDYNVPRLQVTNNGISILTFNSALNRVLYALSKFKTDHNKGMDFYADYRLKAFSNMEKKVQELQREAKDLYSRLVEEKSKDTASFKRFIETKKLIFAKDAVLPICLKLIEEDKRSESGFIREVLSEYYIADGMPISCDNIDMGKISREIEDAWAKAEKTLLVKKSSSDLIGSRYNNIFQNIKRIVCLLCDYVLTIGDNKIDAGDDTFVDYKRIRPGLLADIAEAIESLKSDSTAECGVLVETLNELSEKISGSYEEDRHRYFYLAFLHNDHVLLDNNFMPILDRVEYLDVLSPENRILKHFTETEVPFAQRLANIFGGADDYGSAELILRWMKQHQIEDTDVSAYEEDFEAVSLQPLEDVDNKYQSFVADMEMAQSQGQIDNTDGNYKDSILQTVDKWRTTLDESRNYGFFYKILNEFRNQIHINARIRAKDMNASLNIYLNKNPKWETDETIASVIKIIRTRIENQNYTSAEDLLNRLIAGDTAVDFGIFKKDYLEEFLDEYAIHNSQVGNAQKTVQQLLKIHGINKDTRGASHLVDSWPSGNGVTKEKIANLFMAMGFNIDPAEVRKLDTINRKDHFTVKLKSPENGRKTNYKHPIYVFGSEAEKEGFRVVCIFGKMDADRLTETFKDIGNTKNTIILLDYALTLPDRRKLARKVKADYSGKTFAVIDRIVLAYLARHYSETEVNRRLMAVIMPYSALQPYVAESSKVMPTELFMGRKTELEKIESFGGVNIVYGGRQLGKSALLRMAQKNIDRDENGDRAVLVDIKGKNYKEAAKKVSAALSDEQFFPEEFIIDDWGELAREIKNRLRSEVNRIPYFLLLMDEADTFIDSCGQIGYTPFDDLKDIQSLGTGRFKFVVAGLRNVVRFNRDVALGNNSVLTHLSALTVRPFRYTEARELIEVPLSYLGFRFPNDEKTDSLISNICGTTNYFPGLIQLYCTKLIDAMKQDYAGYSESETPPYLVREDHIKRALSDKTLTVQIKEKFDITLKVGDDDYYFIIALLGAYLYHNSGNNSFSAEDILMAASDYTIAKIEVLDVNKIDALMKEMCELNVLQDTGSGVYRFARYSFYQMMGTIHDIEEEILKYGVAGV